MVQQVAASSGRFNKLIRQAEAGRQRACATPAPSFIGTLNNVNPLHSSVLLNQS